MLEREFPRAELLVRPDPVEFRPAVREDDAERDFPELDLLVPELALLPLEPFRLDFVAVLLPRELFACLVAIFFSFSLKNSKETTSRESHIPEVDRAV